MNKFDEIKEFKKLLDEGVITLEEFNKKKSELLGIENLNEDSSNTILSDSVLQENYCSNEPAVKNVTLQEITKNDSISTNDNEANLHNEKNNTNEKEESSTVNEMSKTVPPKFIPNQDTLKETFPKKIMDKLSKFTKKQKIIFGSLIIIILIVTFSLLTAKSPHEKMSDYNISKLRKIDSVETVNAVFCIKDDEDETDEKYVIFYKNTYGNETAVFDSDGTYLGNGTNGGYYKDSWEESANNLQAAYHAKQALEFLDSEFTAETYKNHMKKEYDNKEGIVYIEFNDFLSWFK